jgi:hypothetical protein
LGTAVYFAKLFPLFKPEKGGSLGGILFLVAGVVALGILGFFLFPGLLHPISWMEAIFMVVLGYGLYRFWLRKPRTITQLKTDWAIFSILICTLAISLAVLCIKTQQ